MLDCIVIVCGSCSDQAGPHIINYTEQILAGYLTPRLHLVEYDCHNPIVSQFLAQMANTRQTNNFHCYSTSSEVPIYTSDDIARLLKEIQEAQVMERRVEISTSQSIAIIRIRIIWSELRNSTKTL